MLKILSHSFPDILAAYGGNGFMVSPDGVVSVRCGSYQLPIPVRCELFVADAGMVIGCEVYIPPAAPVADTGGA
jgi:hypothetical protein